MCQTCKTVQREVKRGLDPGSRKAVLEMIGQEMVHRPPGHFDALLDEVLGTREPPRDPGREGAWERSRR